MNPLVLVEIRKLLQARTGVSEAHLEEARITDRITRRARQLGLSSPEYADLVRRSESEVEELYRLFLNGESFFFRDELHMEVLRRQLLPELIRENEPLGSLRLWSAGCSTGEEAYTLAILAHEALLEREDFGRWTISVLGSDLNPVALERAREGTYPPWSLRGVPPSLLERYFHRVGAEWRVAQAFRESVRWCRANLLDEPPAGAMDLVVCRNVFIYLDPAAIQRALLHLQGALRPGGYLLAGHAEVGPTVPELLEPRRLGRVQVYRRLSRRAMPVPTPRPAAQVARRPIPPPRSEFGPPPEALVPEFEQSARSLLERGEHEQARQFCARWMESSPLDWRAHFFSAALAQIEGQIPEAIALLKKVLYLRPSCAAAYLELSELHRLQGDMQRSRRLREVTRGLLLSLPPDTRLEPLELTAGDVLENLEG